MLFKPYLNYKWTLIVFCKTSNLDLEYKIGTRAHAHKINQGSLQTIITDNGTETKNLKITIWELGSIKVWLLTSTSTTDTEFENMVRKIESFLRRTGKLLCNKQSGLCLVMVTIFN